MAGSTTRGTTPVPVTSGSEVTETINGANTTAINGSVVPDIGLLDSNNPDRKISPLGADSGLALDATLTGGNAAMQMAAPLITAPTLHRLAVTAADSSDPATTTTTSATLPTGAVIGQRLYRTIHFDCQLTCSAGSASVTVAPMYWVPSITVSGQTYGGYWSSSGVTTLLQSGTAPLQATVVAAAGGRTMYLKVLSITGSGASLSVLATQL